EPLPGPAQSETLSMRGNPLHGNREIPASSAGGAADRSGKGSPRKPDTHDAGKSDGRIVPRKPPNNDGLPTSAEAAEGRRPTEGNSLQTATSPTQSGTGVSSGLERVRQVARRDKKARFTALLHHVDADALTRSSYALKSQAAPGSDGVTWRQYEEG